MFFSHLHTIDTYKPYSMGTQVKPKDGIEMKAKKKGDEKTRKKR